MAFRPYPHSGATPAYALPDLSAQFDGACKRLIAIFSIIQIVLGPIPAIPIFFSTGQVAIGFLVLCCCMGLTGITGIIFSCCPVLPSSSTPSPTGDSSKTSPVVTFLRVFIGLLVLVILAALGSIIHGAIILSGLVSQFDGQSMSGILSITFPVVILFAEIPQLFILIRLRRRFDKATQPGASVNQQTVLTRDGPILVGGYHANQFGQTVPAGVAPPDYAAAGGRARDVVANSDTGSRDQLNGLSSGHFDPPPSYQDTVKLHRVTEA